VASPRVSFDIPAHNAGCHIEVSLRSTLGQTFGDLEVIVLDECNTDVPLAIVKKIADERVRVVAGAGRGVASTLNACIAAASGELLARLDHAVIALPDRLEWHWIRARPPISDHGVGVARATCREASFSRTAHE
jgi:glycosyltransferase EpsE